MVKRGVVAGAVLVFGWGCGSPRLGAPIAQFPTRTELETVAQQPATPVAPFQVLSVDRWQFSGTAPAPGSAYPSATAWDAQLHAAVAAKPGLQASPELRCAASEAARFYVEHSAFPDGALRAWLVARCGSSLSHTSINSLTLQVDDARTEADIAASVQDQVKQLIAGLAAQSSVGLAFARGQGRAGVVLFHGAPLVALDHLPAQVTGDLFRISGQLLGGAASAEALVTLGHYGVTLCEPDRRLESSRFAFTCPMSMQDEQAVVQILTRRPQRLLAQPVLRAMILRSADAGRVYDEEFAELGARPTGSAPPGKLPSFQDSLLTALNRIRRAAHEDPLALETRQSRFNTQLAPQFFQASYGDDGERSDRIALGVLAGWDVDGLIRGGGVYANDEQTLDGARWLGMALKDPMGRATFLDPEMSRIAIGTLPREASGVMALVSTYALFDSAEHSSEEDEIFTELAKQREARGLPAPLRRARGKELTDALLRIAGGQINGAEALQRALNTVGAATGLEMQGLVIETSDISMIPLAAGLLAPGSLQLEVGVAHYKPSGGAWGQYVVLYLFTRDAAAEEGGRRAAAPGSPGLLTALRVE
jgi:hypothetical protein